MNMDMNGIEMKESLCTLSGMEIVDIVFDSRKQSWNINNSTFRQKLNGKKKLMIVIKDTDGNVFGGYVNSKIYGTNFHFDNECYLFSLVKNNKLTMKKYPIKKDEYSFKISSDNYGMLFAFGGKENEEGFLNGHMDLIVHKNNCNNNKCWFKQDSFEYGEEEYALVGKEETTTDQIIVYQMEDYKESTEERNICSNIQSEFLFESKLFDSKYNNWSKNTSDFSKAIEGRENIIIVVEDQNGDVFGGYIPNRIIKGEWISDPNMYLFSYKKNGRINLRKYPLKQGEKGFIVYNDDENLLFGFGYYEKDRDSRDLGVMKKDAGLNSYCHQRVFEYYENKTHSLSNRTRFLTKRVIVFQMKSQKPQSNEN